MFQAAPRYAQNSMPISTSRRSLGRNGGAPRSAASPSPPRSLTAARLLSAAPAEEALGSQQQHDREDGEDHELLQRAWQERRAERLREADDEPAEKRADEVAHAAEHDHHEGHQVERFAYVGGYVEERGNQGAGHGHAPRADAEGDGADSADVDPDELGALRLLGERADCLAHV